MKSFSGLASYNLRYAQGFAAKASPLHKARETSSTFQRTDEAQYSFDFLKTCFTTTPILAFPWRRCWPRSMIATSVLYATRQKRFSKSQQIFGSTPQNSGNSDFHKTFPTLFVGISLHSSRTPSHTPLAAQFQGTRWNNSTLAGEVSSFRLWSETLTRKVDWSCRRSLGNSSITECKSRNFP